MKPPRSADGVDGDAYKATAAGEKTSESASDPTMAERSSDTAKSDTAHSSMSDGVAVEQSSSDSVDNSSVSDGMSAGGSSSDSVGENTGGISNTAATEQPST